MLSVPADDSRGIGLLHSYVQRRHPLPAVKGRGARRRACVLLADVPGPLAMSTPTHPC